MEKNVVSLRANPRVASRAQPRLSPALVALMVTLPIAWFLPAAAAPANDLFVNRSTITGTNTTVTGSNVDATKEIGEPNHVGNPGGHSVWWKWTAPRDGIATVRTDGSSFDTLLAVYTNSTLATLSLLANDNNSGVGLASTVIFSSFSNVTYQIVVDGFNGALGNIQLQVSLNVRPTNDVFATAMNLTTNRDVTVIWNALATKEAGETNHAGRVGGRSLWWRWTAPQNGGMLITTLNSTTGNAPLNTLLAAYTGTTVNNLSPIAANDDWSRGPVTSVTNFAATAGTTYRIAVDTFNGANGAVFLNHRFEPIPSNDSFANATGLSGFANVVFGTNVGATKELGEQNHADDIGGASVWWRWTAAASTPVTISTTNSNFDTLLAIYTYNPASILTLVTNQDDIVSGTVTNSEVTFTPVAGRDYFIAVDGWANDRGDIRLAIAQEPPPGPSVSLDGAINGGVYRNTNTLRLVPLVSNLENAGGRLCIYDDTTLIFSRPFDPTNSYSFVFYWNEPPLGLHPLRAVYTNQLQTVESAISTITVTGSDLGFASQSNLQTSPAPPEFDSDTTIGCQLGVHNLTAAPTNPLRVRVLRKETRFYLEREDVYDPAPLNETFQAFQSSVAALGPAGSVTVSIPLTASLTCPKSVLLEDDFPADHLQFHLYAALEEQIGTTWTLIDETKIFSSVPISDWFPFNDGPVPANALANTNLQAHLTNLFISGPTNLASGMATSFVAVAQLSDSNSGTVQPTSWIGDPFPIGPGGTFTAPNLPSNATLKVIANYTRDRVMRSGTGVVTIARSVVPPVITAQPQSIVTNPGSNVTFSVTATDPGPLRYQWRHNGTNLVNATNTALPLLAVQYTNAGVYSVIVSNSMASVLSSNANLTLRPTLASQGRLANGSFQLRLTSAAGSTFAIESSTNLQTNSWTVLTNVAVPASPFLFTDPVTNLPRRFYRGRLLP